MSKLKHITFLNDDPTAELEDFLLGKIIPGFSLREISKDDTMKISNKIKGSRSCN